jgi:lysophospholipase L1-like esterase
MPSATLPFAVDAEWPFNDGSGTTVRDISGNGHNATFASVGSAMTWNGYGLAFNANGDSFPGAQAALTNITNFKSIIIAHCIYPDIQTTGTGGNLPYTAAPTIFGSSTADGINFSGAQTAGEGSTFGAFRPSTVGVSPFSPKAVAVNGYGQCQTSTLTIGASDAFYENGLPVTIATAGSSVAAITSTGGYEFGGGGFGAANVYRGTITYALLSVNTVWTAAQVQQLNTYIQAKLAARKMPVYPTFNQSLSNQLIFAGDSIWAGHGGTGVWTSLLTLNNTYNVTNWSISGITAWDTGRLAESRWYSQIASSAARNIVIFNPGTNDLFQTFTAATTWASIALEAKKTLAAGAIPVVSTIISRSGQDTADASLNVLIRAGWKQAGFAALLDTAELPQFAAGGYSNATYYQADGIHPKGGAVCTNADGYGLLCLESSRMVNTLDGSSAANPDTSASNAFVATDANNYVIQTPTAAATYQLVSCAAMTGQVKTIVNGSTGFAITVSPTSPDTIVGSASIAAGTARTFTAAVTSPTAGGCYWIAN